MSILAPINTPAPARPVAPPVAVPRPQPVRQQYLDLKAGVHRKLLNRLNLEALAQADRARAEAEIRTLLLELLGEEATPLSLSERDTLFAEILDDVFGLGPLEPLLRDPTISDILVNTCKHMQPTITRELLDRVCASYFVGDEPDGTEVGSVS